MMEALNQSFLQGLGTVQKLLSADCQGRQVGKNENTTTAGYRTKTLRKKLRFFLIYYFLLFLEFLTYVRIFLVCLCLCVLLTFLHFTFFILQTNIFATFFEFFMPKRKYVVKYKEFQKRFKAVDNSKGQLVARKSGEKSSTTHKL